jgi:hypothetical protein
MAMMASGARSYLFGQKADPFNLDLLISKEGFLLIKNCKGRRTPRPLENDGIHGAISGSWSITQHWLVRVTDIYRTYSLPICLALAQER